jgi:lactoylglutathione lyase
MKKIAIAFLLVICLAFNQNAVAQVKSPRLNHIAFSVLDLKRSTDFYTNIVHLDTIPEPFHDGRHTWLAIGDASHLHLIQNPGPIVTPSKNTHLCFTLASVDDFVEVLKKANLAYEDWNGKANSVTIRVDKVKQVYFQDPDGYWIEINDAKD